MQEEIGGEKPNTYRIHPDRLDFSSAEKFSSKPEQIISKTSSSEEANEPEEENLECERFEMGVGKRVEEARDSLEREEVESEETKGAYQEFLEVKEQAENQYRLMGYWGSLRRVLRNDREGLEKAINEAEKTSPAYYQKVKNDLVGYLERIQEEYSVARTREREAREKLWAKDGLVDQAVEKYSHYLESKGEKPDLSQIRQDLYEQFFEVALEEGMSGVRVKIMPEEKETSDDSNKQEPLMLEEKVEQEQKKRELISWLSKQRWLKRLVLGIGVAIGALGVGKLLQSRSTEIQEEAKTVMLSTQDLVRDLENFIRENLLGQKQAVSEKIIQEGTQHTAEGRVEKKAEKVSTEKSAEKEKERVLDRRPVFLRDKEMIKKEDKFVDEFLKKDFKNRDRFKYLTARELKEIRDGGPLPSHRLYKYFEDDYQKEYEALRRFAKELSPQLEESERLGKLDRDKVYYLIDLHLHS